MVRSNKKKLSRKRTTSKSKKPQKHTKKQNKRLKQPKKTKTRKSKRKTRKLKRKSRKLKGGIVVSSPLRGTENVSNPLYAGEVLREKVLTKKEKQIEAEVESELKELNGNFMFKGNPKGEGLSLYYRFYYKDYNDSNKIYLFLILNNPNDCNIKLREIIIDESYGKKNTHTIIEGNFFYQCINEDLIDISKDLEEILKILYPNKKIIPYDV